MFNLIILYALVIISIAALVLSAIEFLNRRNSASGRFARFFLIRLRELSLTRFFVISILTIFWGLIIKDFNFTGIWMMITLLFVLLFIVHPEVFLTFRKHRKKAQKKVRAARITRILPEAPTAKEAIVLTELVPINPQIQE